MSSGISRREFVANSAMMAFGATVLPRHVLGGRGYRAPSDVLNIAVIGMGQQGVENAEEMLSENLVAICDVDFAFSERMVRNKLRERDGTPRPKGQQLEKKFAAATRYTDFRIMLEKQKDIDAVVVATPDHLHAAIAKTAMQLGKHVYVQKPLTWSIHESRVLQRVARETGVVTQMGNQGHSSKEARLINEWIQAGIIGPVHEVHVWTDRPIWPQGIPQPMSATELLRKSSVTTNWNRRAINETIASAMGGSFTKPAGLNWDLYLGPVADDVPYHPVYHPFNWRGWVPFGVGALGDMGAHLIDHPYWALGLTYPTQVEATSTPWGGPSDNPFCYPLAMSAHYEYPARGSQPPVKLSWYDGGLMPKRPHLLPDDVPLSREGGVIYVGEKGILMHGTYGGNPKLFPESLNDAAKRVPETYPRIEGSHHMNWVNACKGNGQATSPFEYAAPLTENMLLGIVALRAGQGKKILYDAEKMRITNVPDANQYLTREYRAGWSV